MAENTSKEVHHAHLLIGQSQEAELHVRTFCHDLGITVAHNPDFFVLKQETFGINEARELRLLATRKPISSTSKKICLISALQMTLEGQNALLKTFEEPASDTIFFISVREESLIIPTLLSRLNTVRLVSGDVISSARADEFLNLSIKKRLVFAKKFSDDKRHLPAFIDEVLLSLKKKGKMQNIKKAYDVRRFANDPASSSRLILEHLALVL